MIERLLAEQAELAQLYAKKSKILANSATYASQENSNIELQAKMIEELLQSKKKKTSQKNRSV